MHSKIIIKLSVKSISFKFSSLSAICSIYIIFFLWILSDIKENKVKTALLCLVTCKLKCISFMQTWTFFFPIQYPDIAFSYGISGNVKSLVKGCFKAVYNSEAHLGKREGERERWKKGEDKQIVQCISPCLLHIMHFLQFDCPSVGIFTTCEPFRTNRLKKKKASLF